MNAVTTTQFFSEYDRHCIAAATDQGLDPIVAAFKEAGLPVEVEQTGGFCMVAKLYGKDKDHPFGVIDDGPDGAPLYMFGVESNAGVEEEFDGTWLRTSSDLAEVVSAAREWMEANK